MTADMTTETTSPHAEIMWPWHVTVTFKDGRTVRDAHRDIDAAEFSAWHRSLDPAVEKTEIGRTFRNGDPKPATEQAAAYVVAHGLGAAT